MKRSWVLLVLLAAAACDNTGGASAAVTSCRAYCDAVAACPVPIYASASTCRAYECSSLDSSPEHCQMASKAYYDCAVSQPDPCADTGCARQLDAAINCGAGGAP